MFLFNVNLLIFSMCFAMLIICRFIIATREDVRKFEIYALRDELNLLAMRKIVQQESEEYRFLITVINNAIKFIYEGDFNVVDFVKYFINPQLKDTKKVIALLIKIDADPSLSQISKNFFNIISRVINKDLRVIKFVLYCLNIVLDFICRKIITPKRQNREILRDTYNEIQQYDEMVVQPALQASASA